MSAVPDQPEVGRSTLAGLFLVTLATLAFQVLLTRIFSVTMWYHFAFLAVSLAMLGMTAGALVVFLFPERFAPRSLHAALARSSLLFAAAIVVSLLVHLHLPVTTDGSWRSIAAIAATCGVFFVPFTASGVCVALALTRFPSRIGVLYAADLLGAAVGCLSVVVLLALMDGLSAVLAASWVAALGALCFASAAPGAFGLRRFALASVSVLGIVLVANAWLGHRGNAWLRLEWTKSHEGGTSPSPEPLLERWNSHSRVLVWGDPGQDRPPFGWSLSPALPPGFDLPQLNLDIDASAFTVLTRFDGDLRPLGFLEYDMTNLAHYLRRDANVLVIGAGGGRDVLSALVFDQASVLGVEVNAQILDVVNRVYGDFTGHLDRHPKVRFANDEARSYAARLDEHFDIIQISLIDSWAATGAGAFVLTEHSLYTVEAWKTFLDRLAPRGILTVTRFFFPSSPGTAYRLVGLAARALEELGVKAPRNHIALVTQGAMCTLLVSRDPLTRADLDTLDTVGDRLGFETVLSPERVADPVFARVSAGGDQSEFYAGFPFDIEPPTDDRPFFFHMLRLRDILSPEKIGEQGLAEFNTRAVRTLGALLASVTGITLLCVVAPLLARRGLVGARDAASWLLVFGGIGFGFMMIEISQMERLIVFLGHPSYALTVVLFVLLLGSGLGSLATARLPDAALRRGGLGAFLLLLVGLSLFGSLTPGVAEALRGAETPTRIAASAALLLPIGFLMGMPFPLGLRAAARGGARDFTPWLWGVNGAMGVLASVLAIAVALSAGISTSFWVGVAAYGVAALGWVVSTRRLA